MNLKTVFQLLVCLGILGVVFNKAQATTNDGIAVAIVYDTSGSMLEPVKDAAGHSTPKYVVANRALSSIVRQLETVATNHSSGSSRPIEAALYTFHGSAAKVTVPMGPFQAAEMRDWLDHFARPTGNTPLGNTLNMAGRAVLASPLPHKHVLVITDGVNTSGPDPRVVVPRLQKAAGSNSVALAIHFVAFDVNANVFEAIKQQGVTVVGAADEPQLNAQLDYILQRKILLEDEEPKKTIRKANVPMFRAIKRLFIWMGLMAEKATETDAINQAVVERGIRDSKAKADKAHYANGQLAGQIALLRDQIKRQERQRTELQSLLQAAAAANDEANGAHYAEELATLEKDWSDNKAQADNLEQLYQQNTQIIAESLREIQRFQREFEAVKAKVAIGRSLENLAGMMKSSITELQGMMGGEMGQSMQQLRQSAASGEGQMRATLDLAKEMGSGVARQQEARKMRGAMLFQEYKQKMGLVQPQAAANPTPAAPPAERQKIQEQ